MPQSIDYECGDERLSTYMIERKLRKRVGCGKT